MQNKDHYNDNKTMIPGATHKKIEQPRWQRIMLLIIIGYEAAGCLLGGIMLIAAPNGRYMNMPVEIMHDIFPDFLIPGILLLGLGILNTMAFISIFRKAGSGWFMAGLALGGLLIWFVTEIMILQELHWLHAMWGLPVLLGWVIAIPLITIRHDKGVMQKVLLTCGILSSLWYIAINVYVPVKYEGYNIFSQAPSELSAIGSPTRILWNLLVVLYPLLFAAFGWGVRQSTGNSRYLRIVGSLIIVYCILNFYWPPMHRREMIAAGTGTLTDTLHIVWAIMTLIFMMLFMGFGAAALGKRFRVYTITTFIVFIVFGTLTFMASAGIKAGQPTPWMGLWERINISSFMIWVIVFALALLRKRTIPSTNSLTK